MGFGALLRVSLSLSLSLFLPPHTYYTQTSLFTFFLSPNVSFLISRRWMIFGRDLPLRVFQPATHKHTCTHAPPYVYTPTTYLRANIYKEWHFQRKKKRKNSWGTAKNFFSDDDFFGSLLVIYVLLYLSPSFSCPCCRSGDIVVSVIYWRQSQERKEREREKQHKRETICKKKVWRNQSARDFSLFTVGRSDSTMAFDVTHASHHHPIQDTNIGEHAQAPFPYVYIIYLPQRCLICFK